MKFVYKCGSTVYEFFRFATLVLVMLTMAGGSFLQAKAQVASSTSNSGSGLFVEDSIEVPGEVGVGYDLRQFLYENSENAELFWRVSIGADFAEVDDNGVLWALAEEEEVTVQVWDRLMNQRDSLDIALLQVSVEEEGSHLRGVTIDYPEHTQGDLGLEWRRYVEHPGEIVGSNWPLFKGANADPFVQVVEDPSRMDYFGPQFAAGSRADGLWGNCFNENFLRWYSSFRDLSESRSIFDKGRVFVPWESGSYTYGGVFDSGNVSSITLEEYESQLVENYNDLYDPTVYINTAYVGMHQWRYGVNYIDENGEDSSDDNILNYSQLSYGEYPIVLEDGSEFSYPGFTFGDKGAMYSLELSPRGTDGWSECRSGFEVYVVKVDFDEEELYLDWNEGNYDRAVKHVSYNPNYDVRTATDEPWSIIGANATGTIIDGVTGEMVFGDGVGDVTVEYEHIASGAQNKMIFKIRSVLLRSVPPVVAWSNDGRYELDQLLVIGNAEDVVWSLDDSSSPASGAGLYHHDDSVIDGRLDTLVLGDGAGEYALRATHTQTGEEATVQIRVEVRPSIEIPPVQTEPGSEPATSVPEGPVQYPTEISFLSDVVQVPWFEGEGFDASANLDYDVDDDEITWTFENGALETQMGAAIDSASGYVSYGNRGEHLIIEAHGLGAMESYEVIVVRGQFVSVANEQTFCAGFDAVERSGGFEDLFFGGGSWQTVGLNGNSNVVFRFEPAEAEVVFEVDDEAVLTVSEQGSQSAHGKMLSVSSLGERGDYAGFPGSSNNVLRSVASFMGLQVPDARVYATLADGTTLDILNVQVLPEQVVAVDFTTLSDGVHEADENHDEDAFIDGLNETYGAQSNIRFVLGRVANLELAELQDDVLNLSSYSTDWLEEAVDFSAQNNGSRFQVYFAWEIEESGNGDELQALSGANDEYSFVVLEDDTGADPVDVLAHEIGHHLLFTGKEEVEDGKLMSEGNRTCHLSAKEAAVVNRNAKLYLQVEAYSSPEPEIIEQQLP